MGGPGPLLVQLAQALACYKQRGHPRLDSRRTQQGRLPQACTQPRGKAGPRWCPVTSADTCDQAT